MTEITARLSTALSDRYRIEHHLGEGGMATVYLAPRRVPMTAVTSRYLEGFLPTHI